MQHSYIPADAQRQSQKVFGNIGSNKGLSSLDRFRERKHVADTDTVVASFDIYDLADIIDELQAEAAYWRRAADSFRDKWSQILGLNYGAYLKDLTEGKFG